ncbi:MAG: ZPR1 zinc finger domain-containing protein [Promethearchaeota archaeon]
MSDQKDINFKFGFTECPSCSHKMDAIHKVIDIPNFGETIIFTLKCSNCGYKTSDLFAVNEKEPVKYILKYEENDQLKHKIIRSSTCFVRIPELGVEIEPSAASEGYITNVEGILQRVKDITLGLIKNLESDEEVHNALALVQKIDEATNGHFRFNLIIEDPKGNSAIIAEFDDDRLRKESL